MVHDAAQPLVGPVVQRYTVALQRCSSALLPVACGAMGAPWGCGRWSHGATLGGEDMRRDVLIRRYM